VLYIQFSLTNYETNVEVVLLKDFLEILLRVNPEHVKQIKLMLVFHFQHGLKDPLVNLARNNQKSVEIKVFYQLGQKYVQLMLFQLFERKMIRNDL